MPSRRWPIALLWVAVTLATLRLLDLAVFMVDVEATEHRFEPRIRVLDDDVVAKPFFARHSCYTCYAVATELARAGDDNIYDSARYRDPEVETRVHRQIGEHLKIDRYQYPPPFLLLPWLLDLLGGGFFGARALFFAVTVGAFGATLWLLRGFVGGAAGARIWWTWPAVVGVGTTLAALQMGNVHPLVITLCVLAMLAFERGRNVLGGALLGYAVVSKIFPGVLLVHLLARRRWSAAGSVVAWAAAYTGLTYAVFGGAPFEAFVSYQLPRLVDASAFGFAWEHARALTINSSVAGAAHRLGVLGVISDPALPTAILQWLLVLAVVAAAVWLGHISRGDRDLVDPWARIAMLQAWLALLLLAQARSPFLPWTYGNFVVLWLAATVAIGCRSTRGRTVAILAWLPFTAVMPLPFGPASAAFDQAYGVVAFTIAVALAVAGLRTYARARGPGSSNITPPKLARNDGRIGP